MSNREVLLAIDAGGSVVKATAYDTQGGWHTTASRVVPILRTAPGYNERDPNLLWEAVVICIRDVLMNCGENTFVCAIGITGHGNGVYLVDQSGLPVRNAVLASDTRAVKKVRQLISQGVDEELRGCNWNGLWAGQPGPILSFLAETEPGVLAESYALLSCKDYLRARLTGCVRTELSDASAGAIYDNTAWAVEGQDAELQVLELAVEVFGLQPYRHLFHSPVSSFEVTSVTSEASDVTGIPVGVPIVAGLVDNAAMHHGSGVFDGGYICVGAGTWSLNQVLIPAKMATMDQALGRIRPYAASIALGGMALMCEASPTSASTLDWALNRVITNKASQDESAGNSQYFIRLERETHRIRRIDDPVFLPFLDGSREDPGARGAWIGISSSHGEDQLLGAVIEGICFEHRRHLERLKKALTKLPPVRLSGGATKSPIWCQVFADCFGVSVEVSVLSELGSVCAAAMAGTSVSLYGDVCNGVQCLNSDWRSFEPDSSTTDLVAERFKRYCEMAAVFDSLPWMESS